MAHFSEEFYEYIVKEFMDNGIFSRQDLTGMVARARVIYEKDLDDEAQLAKTASRGKQMLLKSKLAQRMVSDTKLVVPILRHINEHYLADVSLKVTDMKDDMTRCQFYCLVLKHRSNAVHGLNPQSSLEREFLIMLIDRSFETGEDVDAEELFRKRQTTANKIEMSKWLNILREQKWIIYTEGKIRMAPRLIADRQLYIEDKFGRTKVRCSICTKVCIWGELCSKCTARTHRNCAIDYFNDEIDYVERCPVCIEPWPKKYKERRAMPQLVKEQVLVQYE